MWCCHAPHQAQSVGGGDDDGLAALELSSFSDACSSQSCHWIPCSTTPPADGNPHHLTEMEPLLALTAVHAGLHPTIGPCWALSSGQQPCNRTAGRRLAFALAARAWIPHNSGRAFALVLLAKPGNHGKLDIITEARKYQSRRRRSFDFSSPSQWNRAFAAAVSKSSCSL
ncbi:hypothetical protein NW761_001856 [Fusarium oxysporum]|jgi:hypothetical protein|uniref:Uncharacterized protein n=1 Tax=Fusarium oxysporum TaxID=5507 RepID=A0A420MNC4_FUSOX|nr:hypothetical protein NW761_001856 [Fusarium oxysporum]KAK2683192.1 hypothetical protein RAB80_001138 [Fusarium oxysporum f. sp. vasinfectum]KAK2937549.1 hypothetical protein FoTM2_000767 [Fusarium oxysporum f. sp. vasinfectum]RKK69536.1 hypothetical protein BFJ69_g12620 [Fusarium oxysporum]WKT39289.1 hypothetical protein QSH57_001108 [Fusarium oxysporum f. sp. vasinfectum]